MLGFRCAFEVGHLLLFSFVPLSAHTAFVLLYLQALLEGKNMKFRPKQKTASQAWKQIMSVKTTVIETIVRHGYDVFVMDADTVLLHNPLDYVGERSSSCDFQWQADGKDKFLFGVLLGNRGSATRGWGGYGMVSQESR